MLVLALKCCFCNDDISSDDYITKGSRCLFTSTILIARKATPQRFLSTNIQFQTNLKFGNKFSASYEASKFCWQIAVNSLQHLILRPCLTLLYCLLTVYTVKLFMLFKLLFTACAVACMPLYLYIVREGYNTIGMGLMRDTAKSWVTGDGWILDNTPNRLS